MPYDSDFDDDETEGTAHTSDGQPRPNEPDAYGATADELRQFVERIEHLEAEKKEIADQIKEVKGEVKGRGYDVKCLMKIIAERKRDANDRAEEEAILEIYRCALGME